MLLMKQVCLCCSKAVFTRKHCNLPNRTIREFSSKNYKIRNKNHPKIEIATKNEYVTHHLNSSIAAHLKRSQKLWNNAVAEERHFRFREDRKTDYYFNEITGKIEQTKYKNGPKNHSKYTTRSSQKTTKVAYNTQNFSGDEDDHSENDSDDLSLEELEPPNWEDMNLVAIKKDFYKPTAKTENRPSEEIQEFLLKTHAKITPDGPKPIFKFEELSDLSQHMIAEIEKRHFKECTPIQSFGIPFALSGINMIAVSQLSTGKTLAMVLSAMIHITHQTPINSRNGPIAVILALTQEAAEEIRQLFYIFCREANIKCTVLKGTRVDDVGELLIATPCHLYELLRTKLINLKRCSQFSLYEADKFIDMGLDEEILQIDSQIRSDCQKLIWASSWSSGLKKLVVDDYVRLDVGSSSLVKENLSENIKQIVKVSEEKKKNVVLVEIIDSIDKQKTLIFTERPEKADKIANMLGRNGYQCKSFHNQKSTVQRNEILSDFQCGKLQYLVLTDVAAKNVNFSYVSNVVNFDMPLCISDYVKRVSRTDHSDNGTVNSYSIVSEEDGHLVDELIGILQQSKQAVDPALFILQAANVDSDDEVAFAIPEEKGFKKYTFDNTQK